MDKAFKELLEVKKALLTARTPVKGVKYDCGCVAGSDRLVMFMFFPQNCIEHKKPIVAFWRE